MKEQFVPYELALKLKKLGFNEECFNMYFKTSKNLSKFDGKLHKNYYQEGVVCSGITAPLWQQAFDWFREKYNLFGYIFDNDKTKLYYWGFSENFSGETIEDTSENAYMTFEDAREEVIEKMIEYIS